MNAILEHIHGVFDDMLRTTKLDLSEGVNNNAIDISTTVAVWASHFTHHTVLQSKPGADIIGQDMLFEIPYIADWTEKGKY